MGKFESEAPTPPEVARTVGALAPPGSPPEKIAGALSLAAELSTAKEPHAAPTTQASQAEGT